MSVITDSVDAEDNSLSTGATVAITVIAVVVILLLIITLICLLFRQTIKPRFVIIVDIDHQLCNNELCDL